VNPRLKEILLMPLPTFWVVLGLLLVLAAGWGWYSSGLVTQLVRYPNQVLPAAFGLRFEKADFTAADGVKLSGWFVPAPALSDATLILCHGWGANKSDILPHTFFLNKKGGHNLFYFDFRNHGDSGGRQSSLGPLEARDLEAAIDFLKKERPAQCRRLGVYGMSMGGAVALTVAAGRPEVEAVAAESAFSSFDETVTRFAKLFYHIPRYPLVPVTLFFVKRRLGLNPDEFSPVRHVGKISPRPVLLIQGDQDARMPVSEGEKLFAAAREPKELWTVPGADHGEPAQMAGAEYEERLLKFFAEAFRRK
jgi:uncharacterized protein